MGNKFNKKGNRINKLLSNEKIILGCWILKLIDGVVLSNYKSKDDDREADSCVLNRY